MDKPQDGKLLDHNYDGIQELDNQLPKWWVYIFYATIVFSAGYYYYYEMGSGPSSQQALENELQEISEMRPQEPAAEDISAYVASDQELAEAKAEYVGKCAACHGQNGEGSIGPNLTDNYWVHGDGKIVSVYEVLQKGVPEKGMPPWEAVIPPAKLKAVAFYVTTLKGTNPANGKEPQGVEITE